MKFSSSLKFNAVPEWWENYIAYDALKKYIYQLEKQSVNQPYRDVEANENSSLIAHADHAQGRNTDALFVPLLDRELEKISRFYDKQQSQAIEDVQELETLIHEEENRPTRRWEDIVEDEDDEDEDDDELGHLERGPSRSPDRRRRRPSISVDTNANGQQESAPPLSPLITSLPTPIRESGSKSRSPTMTRRQGRTLPGRLMDSITSSGFLSVSDHGDDHHAWGSESDYAQDTRLLFKRKITTVYVLVSSLKSYVELNYSGFRKILKKYDKVTDSSLKGEYMSTKLATAQPFNDTSRAILEDLLSRLTSLYTRCVTYGDEPAAIRALKLHQREHIAWERDTVWRTMINQARRGGNSSDTPPLLEGAPTIVTADPEKALVEVPTPLGTFKVTKKLLFLAIAVAVGVTLLNIQVVDGVEANRCLAVLVFCTIMWATEAIPLFVTSLFVPLLLVTLRVIRSAGEKPVRLTTPEATKYIFSVMFSPTIMLLIGGFTIASALSKTAIDRLLITRVLSLAGTKPHTVLLAFMGVACFASMWISNVAAPTLCFTLIKPILRTLPAKSSFAPCLILAIALAANIGGQASPISSPQNLIAIAAMDTPLDWVQWFAVAIPVSSISILLIWLLLIVSYSPARAPDGESEIEIKPVRAAREKFTAKQWWVSFVCVATIGLWCVEHEIEEWVGDMGVIALLPVIAFFATGVLKKDDFEQFAWTIVFLAMGGIALGKGVTSSGLLEVMDEVIRKMVSNLSLYSVVLVLSVVVLVVSTFISHTIASVLLVPIAKELGKSLPGNHGTLLIFITGLICSAGMGMPVSGFPNQTAAAQEDELGQLYLSNIDFLKNGVPASIIATLVVSTVGFMLMKLIGL